jgi:hypothetical protein
MKKIKYLSMLLLVAAVISVATSCEQSEGLKYGTLQKVSHKKFPIEYYAAEFAYDGGRTVSTDKSSSYQNTQEIAIDAAAYDTLQQYVGDKVVFDYKDLGYNGFGKPSKVLTVLKVKQ